MSTAATPGYGCLLKKGDGGSPETFATIGEVVGFDGPSESHGVIDVTNFDSPNGAREFISSGLKDAGQVTFRVNLSADNSTHSGLRNDLWNGTKRNFQAVLTDANPTTIAFSAFITNFAVAAPFEGALNANITLKITGKPSWT